MTMLTDHAGAILPIETANTLLIDPLKNTAVAMNPAVATTVTTSSHEWHAPRLDQGATAAWVAEGQEIPMSDVVISEIIVVPSKAASLTPLSRELAEDSSPDAQSIIGASMVADLQRVIDRAFILRQTAPAPKGLAWLTAPATVDLDLTDLDSFSAAQFTAEARGASITAFLVSPEDALTLATLKTGEGSNQVLMAGQRAINGVPIVVSPNLTAGTIYGVDSSRIYVIVREDVRVDVDESVFFTSDRIAVKTTMRIGFGFPDPGAIVKLTAPTA